MPTISFKVNEEESREIRRRATEQGVSLSEFLRHRALDSGNGDFTLVRCETTGATIFSGAEGGAPFTTETVRKMLADFP